MPAAQRGAQTLYLCDRQRRFESWQRPADSELIAREPAALRRSQQSGIGHAKAFGCGLLLVCRVG